MQRCAWKFRRVGTNRRRYQGLLELKFEVKMLKYPQLPRSFIKFAKFKRKNFTDYQEQGFQ